MDPATGRFLSEDPVFGDLSAPNSLQVFGYANGNPTRFTDPRGTQSSTYDIGLALMWQQVGTELSEMWESMVGGKAHVQPAQNYVEHTPAQGGVGGVVGGVVSTASLRLIPMEQNASQSSKLGMEVGAGFVPFLNPAEKLATGKTVTGEPTSRFWAAVELGLDAAPLVPKAYKAATKALGGEARVARAASGVAGEADALAKRTWEDFLPAAKERTAAAKQQYGDLGLQMSLGGDREAAQRAASARAGAQGAFDELAKMRQDLGLPAAGSENDASALAKLEVDGKSFFGINAHGQEVGLKVNPISRTHAETDVFQQAAKAGVKGGRGRLVVDRDLCTACGAKGAVNSMARQLGIEQLEVVTPGEVAVLPKR